MSSTFEDLEEARKEISSALLKSDCFPAGMELFPAADLEQFEYIKQVISGCDYFLVVSAGKYGSIHPETGISYTEMEYDFATTIGKPIIRLVHKDPFTLLLGKAIEPTDKGKERLKAFRVKLTKSRMVNFWDEIKVLGQQTILALLDIKKRNPSPGWVRGENALTVGIMKELETLRVVANRASTAKSEQLIKFDELKGTTDVPVMIAMKDDSDKGTASGVVTVGNVSIAEAVFMALISNHDTLFIKQAASDLLTNDYAFPKKYHKYNHVWLELPYEKTGHFLHYLESRGLVRGTSSSVVSHWDLTQRGRLHATYLSSRKNLK